jgi:3-oxoacyl-[acyl-carrier protein] reductase
MKNILVTGSSKGLGLEITKKLLEEGHTVYCVSRSITEEFDALKNQFSGRVKHKIFDLKDVTNVKKELFKDFISFQTPLHGFVNNAALAYDDIVTNIHIKPLEEMFAVNVFAPYMITKHAIRNMLFNRVAGSITHISSISVHTGYKGLSMYASTKGALEAFSKNTAREWGVRKVRSNCLVAGFMETAMSGTLSEDQKNRIYKRTSLKQATTLESVAATVAFLQSDAAESITGQNIFVDSGTI